MFLWFITRVTGRSTLGELSTFQFLLYVTMGDMVRQSVTQQDYSMTAAVLAIGTVALLTVAISWVNARWSRGRGITHGIPVIIVDQGNPQTDVMRVERVSIDDIMAAARQDGIERFGDIRLAVLEANGQIAFFTDGSGGSGAPERPSVG